ncbi:ParE family toxin-like protein [Cuspidothrix issatschenkoi]|uniref:ParE family toxin-like protein n=1 Tax=Cuspidothrix issatschenkoi TaxID=230752 RepID=UPI002AD2BE60|nr:hypothetical protein [Cuspidothrix issatschenkoi]
MREKLTGYGEKIPFIRLCIFLINNQENIWSVRITRNYRAIGVLDGDTITWFWVGSHDDYESFFS